MSRQEEQEMREAGICNDCIIAWSSWRVVAQGKGAPPRLHKATHSVVYATIPDVDWGAVIHGREWGWPPPDHVTLRPETRVPLCRKHHDERLG